MILARQTFLTLLALGVMVVALHTEVAAATTSKQSKIDICNSSPSCSWVDPNCVCKGDATPLPDKKYTWNEVALPSPSGNTFMTAPPTSEPTSAPRLEEIISLPEQADTVKVESVEKISSAGVSEIKISGTGPRNALIKIYIYSDPIVVTTNANEHGLWTYILSEKLAGGDHRVVASTAEQSETVRSPLHEFTVVPVAEAKSDDQDFQIIDKKRSDTYVEYLSNAGVLFILGLASLALLIKFVTRKSTLNSG